MKWTGHVETAEMAVADDRTAALLCHLGFVLWVLIFKSQKSTFLRHHAMEALNFHITVFLATMGSMVLMLVLIGFLVLPAVAVTAAVFSITAALAANRGEWYRYPINLRLFS